MITPLEDIQWLIRGGKAVLQVTPRSAHPTWWNASDSLLHANGCLGDDFSDPQVRTTSGGMMMAMTGAC